MKNFAALTLVVLFAQITFGQETEVPMSAQCRQKITKFSSHFAEASMPFFGNIPVSLGKIEVKPKAIALGESGFADGSGSYELIMEDEGEKQVTKIEFTFRYMTEPHCTITTIKLADVM